MPRTIDVNNLHISYYGKEVIKDVSFSLQTGKLIGILGPNGAGKSTLMKAMLNLIPRDGGEITLGGEPLASMRKKIAYVPQRSNIDWDFPIIVKDTVLLGTFPTLGLFRRPAKQDKEWALECLRKVGMEKFKNNQIGELSGGQQQRVFLARALAQKAEYFFLDEPFVGIDVASENVIIDILKTLRDEGKTVFVVHHDLSKVESYFDNLILMNKELIGCGPIDRVFRPELMQEAYQTPFAMIGKLGVGM
ncbi:metal ABC transporter ATP-binding protein [Paenibacillus melissococcoides]|uniref:Metal ABC transporter ATP-binding protein n=1 Tax=Paenibacillus melissococcoides TaxID=2912268 RepID=A0ABN8UAU3_9BACL|nr:MULTISPECIES: metal ABC transporter ATP-binding protein [Paenibacillus]MEB9894556.1 metal ABC transporter ATP-binding protein [Bacillus cereus]CAH8248306.1 metal ABC transporter ATP-binding protein [Paenibacillus melissococcoides]CAH8717876.1 metal ABC transporter ATP-binding protein [Paenibacillus melissococcoides]CAH8719247.1 metal ABC transporter ATP-binding protein [Paenibacillus melissococcoides]GIO80322.1 manganese transport system ATP-binding protein MntB [Paenibacillus dendritiformi